MTSWVLLGIMFLAANLPWFSDKLFYSIPLRSATGNKNIAWCLLELIILYFLVGVLAQFAERATFGQVAPQDWEFYAVTSFLFFVFAFPGFVYKVLWKRTI